MADDKKVIKLKSADEINSDLVTPEELIRTIDEDFENYDPQQAFVIVNDGEGYRFYTSKFSDAEIIQAFEAIKLIILADRFGEY